MREGFIYFMTNKTNSTIYIGVTNNILRRVKEHKEKLIKNSFTVKYNLNKLVYYEYFETIEEAIFREKQLKKWNRKKKESLIFSLNRDWQDLYETLI